MSGREVPRFEFRGILGPPIKKIMTGFRIFQEIIAHVKIIYALKIQNKPGLRIN
jgi:hypothetical protein